MRGRGIDVELRVIRTRGDKDRNLLLVGEGAKELFVREIEEALIRREIDLAVHSVKDLPGELPKGLALAAIPLREDPRDVLVSKNGCSLRELPRGARLGTSSLRRQAQMMAYRPDIEILPMRGNVDTRLKKLSSSVLDGLVLAAAGLARLGLLHHATEYLDDDVCLPAPGQGAIGIESRSEDEHFYRVLDDHASRMEVQAERAFLRRLQGGCRVPIAARARLGSTGLRLKGLVCSPDGKVRIASESEGEASDGERIGCRLAEEILARGATEILKGMA